jgi:hypothetical protein
MVNGQPVTVKLVPSEIGDCDEITGWPDTGLACGCTLCGTAREK